MDQPSPLISPAAVIADPAAGLAFVIGALVLGVVLWLFGRRSLRFAFAGLGVAAGGALASSIPSGLGPAVPWWAVLAAGCLLGLFLGLALFRVTVAAVLGVTLAAVALPLAYISVALLPPPDEASNAAAAAKLTSVHAAGTRTAEALERFRTLRGVLDATRPAPTTEARIAIDWPEDAPAETPVAGDGRSPTVAQSLANAVQATGTRLVGSAAPLWDQLPPRDRLLVLAATALGFLSGVLTGMCAPRGSATLVTASLGAAVWLPAAAYLYTRAPARPFDLPAEPGVWIGGWLALTAIGAAFQSARPREQRPPAVPAGPEPAAA
ncbi:MAG: hypothetical protein IBJ11_00600 [Phycisphaerales bacterium]|nr:hypothetical protein [Phycisphaerales bacterium]